MKPIDDGILIRKLSSKTRIGDCHKSLWEWLELSDDDINGMSGDWRKYPMIGDVPHDVWSCTIKKKVVYGKTLDEVALNAGIYTH